MDDEIGPGEQMASISTVCQIVDSSDSDPSNHNKNVDANQSSHVTLGSDIPNNRTTNSPRKVNITNQVSIILYCSKTSMQKNNTPEQIL